MDNLLTAVLRFTLLLQLLTVYPLIMYIFRIQVYMIISREDLGYFFNMFINGLFGGLSVVVTRLENRINFTYITRMQV